MGGYKNNITTIETVNNTTTTQIPLSKQYSSFQKSFIGREDLTGSRLGRRRNEAEANGEAEGKILVVPSNNTIEVGRTNHTLSSQ